MNGNLTQAFKQWMITAGKATNTANSYVSGINTVSIHHGQDVFGIEDIPTLEQLYQLYGPGGPHAQIGASNSGNVQSGLKQWLEYRRQLAPRMSGGLHIDPVQGRRQWDDFLKQWPASALRDLTLDQYYGPEGDGSFYSWMRDHTKGLGIFNEGVLSAGVRTIKSDKPGEHGPNLKSDGRYIWYSVLGDSAQEASRR